MKIEKPEELEIETKNRVARMEKEFASLPELKVFENQGYDQIIAQVGIPVSAVCEHHLVAFKGDVSIAYIPAHHLVGLSKLARVAEFYFNPTVRTLQERGTQQILNFLKKGLEPQGVMVVCMMQHDCISYRGVKKPSLTITSAVDGVFRSDIGARSEFLQLIKQ